MSRWHRVQSDEVWHFSEGAPLQLWITGPGGDSLTSTQLGPLDQGCSPVCAVPAGSWQAARSTGDYTLVSCTVGPGFDFADFTLAADNPAIAEMLGRHSTALGTLL